MVVEDQSATIEFLTSALRVDAAPVERVDTHSAIVFLAGTSAWKLKRAVKYDYLDFSTAARRKQMCLAEVRLNQRTAPRLYRGVVSVVRRADGAFGLGGAGEEVDWLVEMARFEQRDLADRRAADGQLSTALAERLASVVATFHAHADPISDHGGRRQMLAVVDGNASGFTEYGAGFLDAHECDRVTNEARDAVLTHARLLDARRDAGFVRQCHGDLHLRNIVVLHGAPTLFDAVEFNDDLACIDVWYDFAFLLMDLVRRNLPAHASVVFNRYVAATGDVEGLSLLPLFMSCRAAIRAKTSATAASLEQDAVRRQALGVLAGEYVAMAHRCLHPPPSRVIAIGGLSGSGKSTLAMGLAPDIGGAPGAVVLRSDEIRKELAGVPRLQRLGADAYSAQMSTAVYRTMRERAAQVVRTGQSVIADAVFARANERVAFERVAQAAGVPFVGLWLEAPVDVLVDRATHRGVDVSDADAAVVRQQAVESPGQIDWRRLDASSSHTTVLQQGRRAVVVEGTSRAGR
jgi:hypothetical protein